MAGLREGESITEAVMLTPSCGDREESHFTVGVAAVVPTRSFVFLPREEGDAEDLQQLIPVLQHGEEAETEVALLLMPFSAEQQTAQQVVVEARGWRACVFGSMLKFGGELPVYTDFCIHDTLGGTLGGLNARWIDSKTGAGMSLRAPLAALVETTGEKPKGVLHVLPRSSRFVVMTSGCSEEGFTPRSNVLLNFSETSVSDGDAVLYRNAFGDRPCLQRMGRAGRYASNFVITQQTQLNRVPRGLLGG